ncbi:unnamed protein product [Microthlaspi erraticum]|uniref:Uncharacterized protein n=1 Tax=Microthlaspi erraticum TaxID=1685480 RepID=A0A6D2JRI3_9BRAS|nr:unnamed protein product [Microthlaspi erraticum]
MDKMVSKIKSLEKKVSGSSSKKKKSKAPTFPRSRSLLTTPRRLPAQEPHRASSFEPREGEDNSQRRRKSSKARRSSSTTGLDRFELASSTKAKGATPLRDEEEEEEEPQARSSEEPVAVELLMAVSISRPRPCLPVLWGALRSFGAFWSIWDVRSMEGTWHGRSSTGYAKEEGGSHLEDQLDHLLDRPSFNSIELEVKAILHMEVMEIAGKGPLRAPISLALEMRKDIKKKCYSRPQPSYLWRFKEGFKGGSYPIPRNKARTTWE